MIRLYDTMTREKREFVPADPRRVTMYVCGPTVYGRAHIGNARPEVVFDTLGRLIRHVYGPDSLAHARNITDVEDKIIAAASAEGVEPRVITDRYERFYVEDLQQLGVAPPAIVPRATETIGEMIALIEALVNRGNAYCAEGHVLFHVPSDPEYGALSRRDRDALIAGARVEVAPYKRDPADFVLWKPSSEDVIGWDSPWGRGRPGWHIECSAMIRAYLGETIDIHGGGIDLIFPHHENEIAQSRCAHDGAPLANYWMHNGMVDMDAAKMSKSVGNVVTMDALLDAGHRGETLRLALLAAQYRQPLAWTDAGIAQAKAMLDRLYRAAGDAEPAQVDEGVLDALCDDLNTPLALSRLMALDDPATIRASAALLGLLQQPADDWFKGRTHHVTTGGLVGVGAEVTAEVVRGERYIDEKIAERTQAKARRDFAAADRIRDELKAQGIVLEDGPDGTTWRRE